MPGHQLLGGIRVQDLEELRVFLFLVEDRHKPVLQVEVSRGHDLCAPGIFGEGALPLEHGGPDPFARGKGTVKGIDEPPCGLDQHAVAHGHDRCHPFIQQLAGNGSIDLLFGFGGLACLQKNERDAVFLQRPGQLVRGDRFRGPLDKLAPVFWVLEAERAQAVALIVDPVPIEVDHVVRLAFRVCLSEGFLQGGEGRRLQNGQLGEVPQIGHGLYQGPGAGPVVNVSDTLLLRPGTEQQNPDWELVVCGRPRAVERHPPPHSDRMFALEEPVFAVVDQLPRERHQEAGRCLGCRGLLFRCALDELGIHLN